MSATEKRLIEVQYHSSCQSCGETVERGERAWWMRGIGIWHEECKEPQSARKDAARNREVEFGSAPLLKDGDEQ